LEGGDGPHRKPGHHHGHLYQRRRHHDRAHAKTIAALFADQFKAPKPPTERNGQYGFAFTEQKAPGQAWVATSGDVFMVTTFTGDRKTGLAFVRRYIKSQDYADLLPR